MTDAGSRLLGDVSERSDIVQRMSQVVRVEMNDLLARIVNIGECRNGEGGRLVEENQFKTFLTNTWGKKLFMHLARKITPNKPKIDRLL